MFAGSFAEFVRFLRAFEAFLRSWCAWIYNGIEEGRKEKPKMSKNVICKIRGLEMRRRVR